MNVQQLMIRNAMKMPVHQDARAHRQEQAYNPVVQVTQFIASALRASNCRETESTVWSFPEKTSG